MPWEVIVSFFSSLKFKSSYSSLSRSEEIALIAKAAHKPFYAAAERFVVVLDFVRKVVKGGLSYKFHRVFPLSQYDLPNHSLNSIFTIPERGSTKKGEQSETAHNSSDSLARYPEVDYTR
jgi:translation initiation factor 2B subunit (eIF-2B alpha/beta/delta family)